MDKDDKTKNYINFAHKRGNFKRSQQEQCKDTLNQSALFKSLKINSPRYKGKLLDGDIEDLSCKEKEYVHVWVDGGGNRGPGSLGVVVVIDAVITMTYGEYLGDMQTNNTAELQAIRRGLGLVKHLKRPVKIYSDSQYAVCSLCGLYNGKKNRKLIDSIVDYLLQYPQQITFIKVRGHKGLPHNEMADSIASAVLKMGKESSHGLKKRKID